MKKREVNFLFILGACSVLTLTSCFSDPKYQEVNFEMPENLKNGSLKILNKDNEEDDIKTGDIVKIATEAKPGYKLASLKANDVDITLNPKFQATDTQYKIEATFEKLNPVEYKGSFDTENKTTYETVSSTYGISTIPNQMKSRILVVPVEFSDVASFTPNELNNLNKCFNGSKSDGSNDYWESVSSFYKKSSYGNVELTFDIVDPYKTKLTSNQFIALESNDSARGCYRLLHDMYDNLKINGMSIDYTNYDVNKDGYIDGVWMIHNYRNKTGVFEKNYFWAYCHNYTKMLPDITKPTFSKYANCSQAFLYQAKENTIQYGLDAHTLIHETGHMFGLDDYYSYDSIRDERGNITQVIGATGGIDMMDLNIGDHNSFSKFALGWINPYEVRENTDIVLKPFKENGEAIVIPVRPKMTSAFNEYIILEYYTPDWLNELDSSTNYNHRYPKVYEKPGIKIFHIDAHLCDINHIDKGDVSNILVPFEDLDDKNIREVALSNTATFNHYQYEKDVIAGKYNLIEAITPDNIRTYNNDFLGTRGNNKPIRGLFEPGDVFNYKTCSNFFTKENYLHNQTFDFPWSIRVENLTKDGASISIEKIA